MNNLSNFDDGFAFICKASEWGDASASSIEDNAANGSKDESNVQVICLQFLSDDQIKFIAWRKRNLRPG